MSSYLSVNDTLRKLEELCGLPVQVEGILTASYNGTIRGYALLHFPSVERRAFNDESSQVQQVSLWLEFGVGSVQPNRPVLARWLGKRVRVHGIAQGPKYLRSPEVECAMSSDPSCWQAHLEVYSVQRITSEQRKQHGA